VLFFDPSTRGFGEVIRCEQVISRTRFDRVPFEARGSVKRTTNTGEREVR